VLKGKIPALLELFWTLDMRSSGRGASSDKHPRGTFLWGPTSKCMIEPIGRVRV
jgi:hypothetical protein